MPGKALKKKAGQVYAKLKKAHPDARIALTFKNPLELMVATILSAQCTDAKVNEVTRKLFKKYKKPKDYVSRPIEELEEDIHSTGFYKQKAKSLRGAMEGLIANFNGEVAADMDSLTSLPGIGRKTANVILGNAFEIPGIAVDTHVSRVSQRIGLTKETKPDKIEFALNELYPEKEWTRLSHVLIFHGRYTCKAKKPLCDKCSISSSCDYYKKQVNK